MILVMVASTPPAAFSGAAKSIGLPLRSKPLDNSRLLIYVDAVAKLLDSIADF